MPTAPGGKRLPYTAAGYKTLATLLRSAEKKKKKKKTKAQTQAQTKTQRENVIALMGALGDKGVLQQFELEATRTRKKD